MKNLFLIIVLLAFTRLAHAGAMMFGTDDNIHPITDVSVTGPEGQPMQLAHRVSLHFFVAGIYTTDEGYVLVEKGKTDLYYTLTPELIAEYQASNSVPNPLPAYKIPLWDYLFGYSLWLIVASLILFYVIKDKFFSKKETPENKPAG